MRPWLILAAVAIILSGCRSITHPERVKPQQDIQSTVPSGEGPPFGPPP
jgi:hypothetical protein